MTRSVLPFSIITLFQLLLANASSCPPEELIQPCDCLQGYISLLICSHIFRGEDLLRVTRNIADFPIDEFHIYYAKMDHLPDALFNGTEIMYLNVDDSTFKSLGSSTGTSPFVGLENNVGFFSSFRTVTTAEEWDWNVFSVMANLQYIMMYENGLKRISAAFGTLSRKMKDITFTMNGDIEDIEAEALRPFELLETVKIDKSRLKRLRRDMFPRPAKELKSITISEGLISIIDNDTFNEMPKLRSLTLRSNRLQTMPQNIFGDLMSKLIVLDLTDNPIHCDCDLLWIKEQKTLPEWLDMPTCVSPPALANRSLLELTRDEICPKTN